MNINNQENLNQEKDKNNSKKFKLSHQRHGFDPILASQIGIPEAIMVAHFIHWISYNKRAKKNFHDGKTWSYQTMDEISFHFDYLNKKQIERLLNKLVNEHKILIKGNYNKSKFDRTCWYAFNDEDLFIQKSSEMHIPKSGNGSLQNGTPIPHTKPYTKEISSKEDIKKAAPASKISKEKKREHEVFTTDEEHNKLEEKYGEEIRDKCYQILSNWKKDTPRAKWKKCDYRSVNRWVINAYKEQKRIEEKNKKENSYETNKELANKIAENFNRSVAKEKGIKIEALNKSVEFVFLRSQKIPLVVQYSQEGFKEQINNLMRKLKLI